MQNGEGKGKPKGHFSGDRASQLTPEEEREGWQLVGQKRGSAHPQFQLSSPDTTRSTGATTATARLSTLEYPLLHTQNEMAGAECEWPVVWPVPKLPAAGSVGATQEADH